MFEDCTLEQKHQIVVDSLTDASELDYFVGWLQSQDTNRRSLNDWSTDDLRGMIEVYKSTVDRSKGSPDMRKSDQAELDTIGKLGMQTDDGRHESQISQSTVEVVSDHRSKAKLVHALSMQIEATSNLRIDHVKVGKVVKEKKGMFGSRNIYWIDTEGEGWSVPRRLSDFSWLSERLSREFPGISVAYIDAVG